MPIANAEIGSELDKIADLLEIEGANPFRVRAYRRAARVVSQLPRSITDMIAEGKNLADLPAIGADLAEKITLMARGVHPPLLDQLEHEVPPGLADLLALPSLGPKRVRLLYEKLKICSIDQLVDAAKTGKLRSIQGFGLGIEARLLRALPQAGQRQRTKLVVAEQIALPLLEYLRGAENVEHAEIAGSYRRRCETVGDLDIVATAQPARHVMRRFTTYEDVAEIVEAGPTRATVLLRNQMQVDLRVVAPESLGAALCYFTGSKAHNIALRRLAIDRGRKLNEYGLFKGAARLRARSEAELYRRLGLAFVPPELRESRGEIEAAQRDELPHLITVGDIRGDLHVHTTASDGTASLPDMARAAQAKGYEYVAITDHSPNIAVVHGLDTHRLAQQISAIDRLNDQLSGIVVLKSIELDILEDGSLDLPDSILRKLDIVVAAIHSNFDLPQARQTERILRALDNRHVNILAHPTGRMINERPGYALDLEKVMRGAVDRGCYLEVNAQPDRLDLNDVHCRLAKELGLKVAISTDAHATTGLDLMRFGVDQARRGWLEPEDVLNTSALTELKKLLGRRR